MSVGFLSRSLVTYVRYKAGSYRPFLVVVVPTKKCNLRCTYCTENRKETKDPLSVEEWFRVMRDLRKMGVSTLSFSGGEPLLYPEIGKLVRFAKKHGFFVNVNTNGTLIDRGMARLLKRYCDTIRISCDAWGGEHDKISGKAGTFDRVKSGILNLSMVPGKAKVGVNCVVTRENKKDAKELAEGFRDDVDFIAFLPAFGFRCSSVPVEPGDDIRELRKKLGKRSGNTSGFLTTHSGECDAGKLYFQIFPGGGVAPCPFTPRRYSIRRWGLTEIYSKMVAEEPVKCTGCHATCTTEVSKVFRMNPFGLAKDFISLKETFRL